MQAKIRSKRRMNPRREFENKTFTDRTKRSIPGSLLFSANILPLKYMSESIIEMIPVKVKSM